VERPTLVIDSLPESVARYRDGYTIVAVDVFRATTTAVTALALGHRCFPVSTIEDADARLQEVPGALLVGELGGYMPYGFSIDNSPSELVERFDHERSVILLSTSGTRLMLGAGPGQDVYSACLRNFRAVALHVLSTGRPVALIGAGARGEPRDEDTACCAWIADVLIEHGYVPESAATGALIDQWRDAPLERIAEGASAAFLRETDRERDITFVLEHVNDVSLVPRLVGHELVCQAAV
jgi:2-phosphosulfolactate phosphatase